MPSRTEEMSAAISILLVDDNEIDVMAFERGLKKNRIENNFVVADHGKEALEILRGTHASKQIEPPYIIFLDLNMPVMNGHEFLDEMRADPELASSVVFVLTTSDLPSDVRTAYQSHVAGYILKSDVGKTCANLHELMQSYWRIVMLPHPDDSLGR